MKRKLYASILCALLASSTFNTKASNILEEYKNYIATTLIGLGVTGYTAHYWAKHPDNEVSKERLKLITLNEKHLESKEYIVLFAHGIDPRPNAYIEQAQAYADILECAAITFTFNDTLRRINLAQQTDFDCLQMAYTYVRETYPDKKIILTGVSRGASTTTKFLATNPENIFATILESPWDTIEHLINHIAHNYLTYLPGSRLLLRNLVRLLPNLQKNYPEVIETISELKIQFPLFLSYSTIDKVVPPQGSQNVSEKLHTNGNNISIYELHEGKHGKLHQLEQLQEYIRAFITSLQSF